MRVGVGGAGLAVGGPAGMRDANRSGNVLPFAIGFQVRDLAFRFIDIEFAGGIDQRHAGAVIAAVFQPLKTFDQNGVGRIPAQIANNSAHMSSSFFKGAKLRKRYEKCAFRTTFC